MCGEMEYIMMDKITMLATQWAKEYEELIMREIDIYEEMVLDLEERAKKETDPRKKIELVIKAHSLVKECNAITTEYVKNPKYITQFAFRKMGLV